jgi:hypothetical protein
MTTKKQTEIPGVGTVIVVPLAPLRGLAYKVRVGKVVAPVLQHMGPLFEAASKAMAAKEAAEAAAAAELGSRGEGAAAQEATGNVQLAGIAKAGPALNAVLATLDPETVPDLIREILVATSVIRREGQKRQPVKHDLCDEGRIDLVFENNEAGLLATVWYTLGAHFEGFLGGSASDRNAPPTPTE